MAWSFPSKNSGSNSFADMAGTDGFIITDALDYVLVGATETETLIWRQGQNYSFPSKNSG